MSCSEQGGRHSGRNKPGRPAGVLDPGAGLPGLWRSIFILRSGREGVSVSWRAAQRQPAGGDIHRRADAAPLALPYPNSFLASSMPGAGRAIRAGGDPGQRDQVAPAERRPDAGELLAHRAVILLGVQRPVLADGVAQQQVEHRPRRRGPAGRSDGPRRRPGAGPWPGSLPRPACSSSPASFSGPSPGRLAGGYGSFICRPLCPAVW